MQAIVDLNDFSQGDIGFHQEIIQVSVAYPLIKCPGIDAQGRFKPQLVARG